MLNRGFDMAVEFRLLGHFETFIDGRLVDVGHARQRSVLVTLLIEANRTVSADQLIERVWPGRRRPADPVSALRTYVSLLRRALGGAGEDVTIARQGTGYRLILDGETVDIHRFRGLVDKARTSEDDDSAALLEQALRLWRGEPFAELDTPWLNTIRDSLNRQRQAARIDLADIELQRGRHHALVTELPDHVTEQPLDERLRGQYMLALYRCGRQADALAQYRQIRRHLADELGADPSPALQLMHQRILAADPVLTTVATVSARPESSVTPRQLPAAPRLFTGRRDELARLDAALETRDSTGPEDTAVVSAIVGAGGIGKTWIALQWAHRNLERFPDGQLYLNLRGFDPSDEPVPASTAVRGILDALGVGPASIPVDAQAQGALYRSLVADKRMLIVLDNARSTEHVTPLLPGGPGCTVLVTSRHRLTGLVTAHSAFQLDLDVLSDADARDVLARHLGPGRLADEPGAVTELLAYCAGLPLALGVIAARAGAYPRFPLAVLAKELREASTRLDALDAGEPGTNLRVGLSCSCKALDEEVGRVFELFGTAPGPDISLLAAASLTALPAARVRTAMRHLENVHLVQQHVPARYRMHDLIRLYAVERAGPSEVCDEQRAGAMRRLLDFYLHSAYAATMLLDPHQEPIRLIPPGSPVTPPDIADRTQALAWFTTELPVLLAALNRAAESGLDAHAWQLAWTLSDFLDVRGRWRDLADVQTIGLAAAGRLSDRAGRAEIHRVLGRAHTRLGSLDDAHRHFRRSLELFAELERPLGQARARLGLAALFLQQARNREAIGHALRAMELSDDTGHPGWCGRATNVVAWCYAQAGDHERAIVYCRQALTLFHDINDRAGEANTWDSLGYAYRHLGRHRKAVSCLQRSIALLRELGDRYFEATTEYNLGDAYADCGEPDAARGAWSRALRIFDEIGHRDADQVRARLNLRTTPLRPLSVSRSCTP
jgi:DNA-binding SARP family transcriptional activator/tetratricopeptide (TPR) repeat protein